MNRTKTRVTVANPLFLAASAFLLGALTFALAAIVTAL